MYVCRLGLYVDLVIGHETTSGRHNSGTPYTSEQTSGTATGQITGTVFPEQHEESMASLVDEESNGTAVFLTRGLVGHAYLGMVKLTALTKGYTIQQHQETL